VFENDINGARSQENFSICPKCTEKVRDSQLESHHTECSYRTCPFCYEYYPSEIYETHLEFCEKNPDRSDYNQYASQMSQPIPNNNNSGVNNQNSNQNFEQEINYDEDFDFEDEINEFNGYQPDFGNSNAQNQNNNQERNHVGQNRSPNNHNVNVSVDNGAPWQYDGNPGYSGPLGQGPQGGPVPNQFQGSPPSNQFQGGPVPMHRQGGPQPTGFQQTNNIFGNSDNPFQRNPNPGFQSNQAQGPFANNRNVTTNNTNVTVTRTTIDSNGNRRTVVTRQGGNGNPPQGDIFNNQFGSEMMPPWMHPQGNNPPRMPGQNQPIRPRPQQRMSEVNGSGFNDGLFDAFGVFSLFGQNPVDPLTRGRQNNVRLIVNGQPVDPRETERLADFTNFVRVNRYRLFDDGFMDLIQSHMSGMDAPNRGMDQSELESIPKEKFVKKSNVAVGEEEKCAICMMDFEDQIEVRKLPCSHFYHPQCIDIWLVNNSTCPVCKRDPTNPD